jgi:mycothiol synthase
MAAPILGARFTFHAFVNSLEEKRRRMSHSFSGPSAAVDELANGVEWVIRPYRQGDIPAIVRLTNAADVIDRFDMTTDEEELRVRFEAPRSDPARQVIIVEGPRVDGIPPGMILGWGRLTWFEDEERGERVYEPRLRVYPATRDFGLEEAIAKRLMEMARAHEADPATERRGKVSVQAFLLEKDFSKRTLWANAGLAETRQFWTMERSLTEPLDEPAPIEGVNLRPYSRPEDDKGALEAFNNSFADHFDFHPEPEEDWQHWVSGPFFRPELSWLAEIEERPGKFAGFCLCVVWDEDNRRKGRLEGWVDILGTTREWRRKGLGRALLLHGLHSLRSAGFDTALLGVDSLSPTGANRLYESCGFRIRSREFQYKAALSEVTL